MSRFAADSDLLKPVAGRRALWIVLAVLASGLFGPVSFAGEIPAPVVAKVEIVVDGLPDAGNMDRLITIKPGSAFSLKRLSDCLKQIYWTGLFNDVRVEKSGEDRIVLRFFLSRRLLVRRIRLQGLSGTSGRRLRQALYSLREDGFFSDEQLERAKEELSRALSAEGYFRPRIETALQRSPLTPEIEVTFLVQPGERVRIETLKIISGGNIPWGDFKGAIKIKEGEDYIPAELETEIERLRYQYFKLGYHRAEIELAEEKLDLERRVVSLTLRVVPNERIEILIRGADVPLRLIDPIWEEQIFEEWGINEGEARILSYLREKGYIFATVRSQVERLESVTRIVHSVSPGRRYRIRAVQFEGLSHFRPAEFRRKLGLPEKAPFFGSIDGKRIFELPGEIKLLYQAEGFPEAQVFLKFLPRDGSAVAAYEIIEGTQEVIESIVIEGADQVGPETLRSQLRIREGGPYFSPEIQKEIGKLETYYLNRGWRGTRIEAQVETRERGRFEVRFLITEGTPVRIENVILIGNVTTRRAVVERELLIKEGDLALADKIQNSKRNLERLGIFSEVQMEEIPFSREAENLVITVREGQRNYIGLGAGLETGNEPWSSAHFAVDLRLRGTAEFMRSNMFGRAANLSLVSQFSLAEKRAVASWEQPYFLFGFPLQNSLNAWIEEEDRISFGFKREGLSLTGIKPLAGDLTVLLTMRYSRTTLTFLKVNPSEVDRQFYPYSTASLSTSLIREKRNDTFNPESGSFASLAVEWALPVLGTESDFIKGMAKFQKFFNLGSGVRFSSTFRLGLGKGRIPIHERFFAGGSNSFRGQEFDQLGPGDPVSGNPIGGKALFVLNAEVTFPLSAAVPALSGAVFYDLGQVYPKRSDFRLDSLEHALGFGVRYRTPLGPVRLELGWNLTDPQRKGKPIVFITIGHIF